jgi:hypothetical protein
MQILNAWPLAGDLGIPGAMIVKPGDSEKSILWQRMRRRGEKQMPPMGSALTDPGGTALIGHWIDSIQ